jgi:3-hydroxybutyryl-CoA dehydratase
VSSEIPVRVGDETSFTKTVGESDVYLFAGITGDLSPNHVDREAMAHTRYGERLAHGVLSLGFASTASTQLIARSGGTAVSYGYDRVRFVAPVLIGDTLTTTYTVVEIDDERRRTRANVSIANQRGETCTVAEHVMVFLGDDERPPEVAEQG